MVRISNAATSGYAQYAKVNNLTYDSSKYYRAASFPISVPVSYIVGSYDSATFPPGAIAHFKQVPKGFAQIVIGKGVGHTISNFFTLAGLSSPAIKAIRSIFKKDVFSKMVAGEKVDSNSIKALNQNSDFGVSYAAKDAQGRIK